MGYTLAVIGCGTMGIAVTSGVLASLEGRARAVPNGLITPAPGSGANTPTSSMQVHSEQALPSRFIATVGREESVRRLKKTWAAVGGMAEQVEVLWGDEGNVKAVQESDVVLLCCKPNLAEGILGLDKMSEALDGKILISILAGVTLNQLKGWVPANVTVIRAMPNTPSKVSQAPGLSFDRIS